MNKQNLLRMAAATLAVSVAFAACDKEEETKSDPIDPETAVEIKVAATQTSDTLRIAYNGTLDLSAIFTLEQPEGGTATLSYAIDKQPEFVEGNGETYTPVAAYSVSGDTLTAAQGVRVPDAVNAGDDRVRVVREGVLKVSAEGATALTYTIQMTNKPALVPVITLSEALTEQLEGGILKLTTSGQLRQFTATAFDIAPIDFGSEDIKVEIGAGGEYITEFGVDGEITSTGIFQAGGSVGTAGTGGFIVAYYKGNTLDEVLADENLPQTRLNINVEYVAPTAPVGIELYTEAIGTTGTAAFWRNNANGRQLPSSFILIKLNNGETRPYDGATDSNLGILAGDFDQYLEGRTNEDTEHSGWWSHVALKLNEDLPPVGTTVKFKVTSKAHFGEPDWTVTVETQTTAANPST
ncbi:MAG: hypothetical protein LBL94_06675 [Prevotellaceae bacterium]|jgi:hypothetical protein|nr:hypothetical protein [Prevotellaceae bacterium]